MDTLHLALIIIWGVVTATSFALWLQPGRVRPNGLRYRKVPGGFVWFALVGLTAAICWPFIQNGWLGPWWSLGIIAVGALLVYWISQVRWLDILATVAVLVLLLVPLAPAAAQAFTGWTTPTSTEPSDEDPVDQVGTDESDVPDVYPQRYLDILRDNGYETEVVEGQEIPIFQAKSTKRYDDQRRDWADAVCLPVADREAVLAMVLGSPDCAAQVASGLYRLPVIGLDGKTQQLGEISPWLAQFEDPSGLNDWAEAAMASEGAERIEYARKLVLITLQLEQFANGGVQDGRETDYNFHVTDRLTVDEQNPWDAIPEFALSPDQYKGIFVVFTITYKGFEGCWSEFGINTGDGRFAGFTCEMPTPEPTPTPTPTSEPTPTPTPTSEPTPTPTPTPEPTPTPTPTPEPTPTPTPTPEPCPWDPDLPKDDPNCLEPKDEDNDPTPPEGVDPQPQPDPVETEPPTPPADPIDPGEEPGDPIPPGDDGTPDVPVPDDEGHEPPAEPPAEDPDNTGDTDDPSDGEITDPDAAATAGAGALAFAPLIPWFIGTRRKLRENA